MAESIRLTIDGREVTVPAGSTLLQAAQAAGREVPTVCYHEALTPPGLCRVCVVEVEGARTLQAACVAEAH
ncbi:MAG: 2Fe-2S iron-sulfur cluster binding domain-containing protein, partial [Chloroflexi bacterium]|nr:2Fe-2S iron-sulfur cluster binding domain-containing protein [Chloroflexota bacterium]